VRAAALDGAATAAWSRPRCSLPGDGGVSGLHEPAADRVACEFDAVAHSELLEDVRAVALLLGAPAKTCAMVASDSPGR
jgi:hypothetical protein